MIQTEILLLLQKISLQLEEISNNQDKIKSSIDHLHMEMAEFEDYTLQRIEQYLNPKDLETLSH